MSQCIFAQNEALSKVDIEKFLNLSVEAKNHRAQRLVSLDEFIQMSKEPKTIVLDTRSKKMFDMRHIKGAVHLNFSDFTAAKLEKVIPNKETRILIYCNNNFIDDPRDMDLKSPPLALNIPTFINLFGYGYENIYELGSFVSVKSSKLEFGGEVAK